MVIFHIRERAFTEQELKSVFTYWVRVLGLREYHLFINFLSNSIPQNHLGMNILGHMGFDQYRKRYCIEIPFKTTFLTCLHELGHYYLDKKCNRELICVYEVNNQKKAFKLSNAIMDAFVNYNLIPFQEFRDELEGYYSELLRKGLFCESNISYVQAIYYYIYEFLHLTYILPNKFQKRFKSAISEYLQEVHNFVLKKAYNQKDIAILTGYLKKFDKIKTTSSAGKIIGYIYLTLKHLPFFRKENLKTYLEDRYSLTLK
jgi:hypothetical protein